jgi:shikimate 5-dehydrogenase
MRWCEIGVRGKNRSSSLRFEALSEEIRRLGFENEFETIECDQSEIANCLDKAKSSFQQIRFSDDAGAWALPLLTRIPASIATLRSADSLVCENGDWWPRFFLVDALNHTLAAEPKTIDLTGSVFILGATNKARAAVAALSKIGFGRMLISDPDDSKCETFVEGLKKSYFGIQFQTVARTQVTQLPGVCSVAVNTLADGNDSGSSAELAYFNFLKTGGMWLDLALFPLNKTLQAEAKSVGGTVINGYQAIAAADALWFDAVFSTPSKPAPKFDTTAYAQRLAQVSDLRSVT